MRLVQLSTFVTSKLHGTFCVHDRDYGSSAPHGGQVGVSRRFRAGNKPTDIMDHLGARGLPIRVAILRLLYGYRVKMKVVAWHRGQCRHYDFQSMLDQPSGQVAQLVEHTTENRSVDSSILSLATTLSLFTR